MHIVFPSSYEADVHCVTHTHTLYIVHHNCVERYLYVHEKSVFIKDFYLVIKLNLKPKPTILQCKE